MPLNMCKHALNLKFFLIALIFYFSNHQVKAEGTKLTLQPDGICGIDALIGNCVPCGYDTTNFGDAEEFNALAWTNNGAISNHRSLIKFDLTSIPPGSVVIDAKLSLYYNSTSSNANGFQSSLSGPNDAYIQEVNSPWDEHTVNWNNQPGTISTNQAYLPPSLGTNDDYIVNVTAIIQDQINNPNLNYGMLIRLATESYYRCLLFATSDHPNSALHPKLEVNYTPAVTSCYTMQLGSCDGIDALIADCIPCGYDTSNFGNSEEFNALAWTNGGAISDHRSLIRWNLSNIPQTATVTSALLSLYFNPSSSNAGSIHSNLSGYNDAYLVPITSPWNENIVTWTNQPSTSITNQAYLPHSTSSNQDYLNIDVTGMIQTMISSPSTNYGMMLKLNTESFYRCLLFASSDHPNEALHPKLVICYSLSTSSENDIQIYENLFSVYPNPSTGQIRIQFQNPNLNSVLQVLNNIGEIIYSENLDSTTTIKELNVQLAAGIYMVHVVNSKSTSTKKLIIQ